MQDMLMDVLRALATPNLDIRQKTLDLALDLITHRNIDEVRLLNSACRLSPSLCSPVRLQCRCDACTAGAKLIGPW
jgi:hypothetical protein